MRAGVAAMAVIGSLAAGCGDGIPSAEELRIGVPEGAETVIAGYGFDRESGDFRNAVADFAALAAGEEAVAWMRGEGFTGEFTEETRRRLEAWHAEPERFRVGAPAVVFCDAGPMLFNFSDAGDTLFFADPELRPAALSDDVRTAAKVGDVGVRLTVGEDFRPLAKDSPLMDALEPVPGSEQSIVLCTLAGGGLIGMLPYYTARLTPQDLEAVAPRLTEAETLKAAVSASGRTLTIAVTFGFADAVPAKQAGDALAAYRDRSASHLRAFAYGRTAALISSLRVTAEGTALTLSLTVDEDTAEGVRAELNSPLRRR